MQLLSLTCNHCGAPLEVPGDAKFVTCTHCCSRLAVQRSGGAAYTEVLEALEQRTEQIADDVETLKLQGRLERLDREWMLEREQYMVGDKDGRRHFPSKRRGILSLLMIIGFVILWMAIVQSVPTCLVGLLFIVLVVVTFLTRMQKADQYERRRRHYEREREAILREIESRSP